MLVFEQISKRYANNHIGLSDVSFNVERGELLFITGHSGAGKSTLLKLLLAIERPSSGKLLIAGKDITKINNLQIPFLRRQIGTVFQNHKLLMEKTAFDNVALPLQIIGMQQAQIKNCVMRILERLDLADKAQLFPYELSSGQQQRIGIARAIVHKPALLLADEPTGNLDPRLAAEIMNLFIDINRLGTTIVVVSHDLALIAKMRHRMITLQRGRLISDQEALVNG